MDDIKGLIASLRYYGINYAIGYNLGREIDGTGDLMVAAAEALENLDAQLDVLVKEDIEAQQELAGYRTLGTLEHLQCIHDAPAADPVHATGACYCSECVNYNKPRLGWCGHHMDRENPDDFCSYGRRREDNA